MDMTVLKRADGLTDEEYEERAAEQARRAAVAAAERKQRDIEMIERRVLEEGIIVVPCGKTFAKNMQRAFQLDGINRNRLAELVDGLVKAGVLTCEVVLVGDSAGVVGNRATTRERLYYLTE